MVNWIARITRASALLLLLPASVAAQSGVSFPLGPLTPPVLVFPASAVNGGGTVTSAQILLPDGTSSAPSLAFAAELTTGFRRAGAGTVIYDGSGNDAVAFGTPAAGITLHQTGGLAWGSSGLASTDIGLTRAGVGALKVANPTATATAELQVSGGNGGFISPVKALTELTTIAAAATTNTVIQLPANAVILAVSVRVVTIIPTAATFTVTSATPTKTWNTAAVTVAAGSTDPGTLPGPTFQTTASAITITPNLTPGAATGQVRVTIYYYSVTPPTS